MSRQTFEHPLLKCGISQLIQLILGAAALPIAAALKGQSDSLAASLIPVHSLQLLSLLYGICIAVIGVKLKARGWVPAVIAVIVGILIMLFLFLLESHLLSA